MGGVIAKLQELAAQQSLEPWAIVVICALLALGAGLAPHLSKAVFEGLCSMSGEFVRTPKHGATHSHRYRATADIPTVEIALSLISFASVVASLQTGHWFATPFAMLFTLGYGYVAALVGTEQLAQRRAARLSAADPLPAPTAVPVPTDSQEQLAA